MFLHFGPDFKLIAQEMSRTFIDKPYFPCQLFKSSKAIDPNIKHDDLNPEEAKKIFKLLTECIKEGRKHICKPKKNYNFDREIYSYFSSE
jgi:hypothetical protein